MAPQLPFQIALGVIDRVSGPLRRISRRIGGPQFAGGVRRFGGSLAAATGHVTRVTAGLAAFTAAAGAGMFALTRSTAEAGDNIAKLSDRLGLSTGFLQEVRHAANLSGVDMAVLDSSLVAFTKRLGEARAGSGALFSLLSKTAPGFLDQLLAAPDAEAAFELMLRGIEAAPDQVALAAAAFSRSGTSIVNLAQAGAGGLAAMRQEARDLGLVLEEGATRSSEGFIDSLTRAQAALTGIKNTIGVELMPTVQGLSDSFRGFVLDNRDQIQTWARNFAEGLPGRLEQIRVGVIDVARELRPFVDLAQQVVDRLGPAKAVSLALAGVLSVSLAPAVGAVLVGLQALVALALGNPIGLAITALASAWFIFSNWESVLANIDRLLESVFSRLAGAEAQMPEWMKAETLAGLGSGIFRLPGSGGGYFGLENFIRSARDIFGGGAATGTPAVGESKLTIELPNMPEGTRVFGDLPLGIELDMGPVLGGG